MKRMILQLIVVAETLDDKITILAWKILFINKLVDQVVQSVVNICDI